MAKTATMQRVETGLEQFTPTPSEIERFRNLLGTMERLVGEQARNSDDATHERANDRAAAPRELPRGNAAPQAALRNKGSNRMSDQPNAGNLAHAPSNQMTLADLEKIAEETGRAEATGKDGLTKFLMKVLEGAYVGAIDVTPNKHSNGVDDGTRLTAAYVKARTGSNIFDAKAPNQRVARNRTNTMIKLGMWPHGGQGEPLSTVNSLMTQRSRLMKDPAHCKKLVDASNALLSFARAQIKLKALIPESELNKFLLKSDRDLPSEEDLLDALRKRVTNAKIGKGIDGNMDADTADKLITACTKRLTAIAKAKGDTTPKPPRQQGPATQAPQTPAAPAQPNTPAA